MIIIELNPTEKTHLLLYAEHSLFDSSHWGGSTFLTPEEQIVYDSVKNLDKTLNLSLSQFTILFEWVLSATFRGTILSPDDTALLCKFSIANKSYYTYLKNMYDADIRLTVNIIKNIESMYSSPEVKVETESDELKVEYKETLKRTDVIVPIADENTNIARLPEQQTREEGEKYLKIDKKIARAKLLKQQIHKAAILMKQFLKKTKGKKLY